MARLSCTEESGHPLAHPFADVGEEELVAESNRCAGVERVSPAEMIVLDANILIRAVLGRRVRQLVETYAAQGVRFFAPDIAFDDAHKYARIENRFLLRFAARRPAARGRVVSFHYPAFTSQCVRKSRAPTGSTCWATIFTIFRPSRGWFLANPKA